MGLANWLRSLFLQPPDTRAGADDWQPEPWQPAPLPVDFPSQADAVRYAVNLTGLVIDRPEALAFYHDAFAAGYVTYKELRQIGDLLDKDALRSAGLRGNVKISAQFMATLTDDAKADPLQSASVIGCSISRALASRTSLMHMIQAGIESMELLPSNMAAGPCAAARQLGKRPFPTANAQMLPLHGCPHPDQCGCLYQSDMSFLYED